MTVREQERIIERANELAASGACRGVREIRDWLLDEGFDDAPRVLVRTVVSNDLVFRCKVAALGKAVHLIGLEYELI